MKYLNALNKIAGVGPQKIKILVSSLKDSRKIWNASFQELAKSGIGEKLAETILAERVKINPDEEWEKMAKEDIKMIFASPQFSTESAKMIANEIDGEVILIDPLAKDYIHNMQKVVNAFTEVME